MAAVSIVFVLFVLFALAAPLALYWFVRAEDPDPDETTSWDDARSHAANDARDAARDNQEANGRDDGASADEVEGNHWG